jgi:hypothetical protein
MLGRMDNTMANKGHNFLLTLKMDGKTIATRNVAVEEYNDNVIYSLRLNQLMNDMGKLITDAMKDKSITDAFRLLARGHFSRSGN